MALGSSFQFAPTPGNTLLSSLNGGQGITFNTGVAAANSLPYGPGEASTDASSNGQLASDLSCTLLINGTSFPLSLAASLTQSNSSINDLVNELNTALAAATGNSAYSGMLSFRTAGSGLALMVGNSAVTAASNLPYGPGQASTDPATNGQLASDLSCTLLINGTSFPLSLAATATQSNSSINDLVNELNTALAGELSSSTYSGNLSFIASGQAVSLVASGSSITSLTINGATQLGFNASETSPSITSLE